MVTVKNFISTQFIEDFKINLKDFINLNHAGNVSHFARSMGVMPYQVQRWIERGCQWQTGSVWCPISKRKKSEQEK